MGMEEKSMAGYFMGRRTDTLPGLGCYDDPSRAAHYQQFMKTTYPLLPGVLAPLDLLSGAGGGQALHQVLGAARPGPRFNDGAQAHGGYFRLDGEGKPHAAQERHLRPDGAGPSGDTDRR